MFECGAAFYVFEIVLENRRLQCPLCFMMDISESYYLKLLFRVKTKTLSQFSGSIGYCILLGINHSVLLTLAEYIAFRGRIG